MNRNDRPFSFDDEREIRVKWDSFGSRRAMSLSMLFSAYSPPVWLMRDLAEIRWRPAHKVNGLGLAWVEMMRRSKVEGYTSFAAPPQPMSGIERWIFIRPGTAPYGDWTTEEEARYMADAEKVLDDYIFDVKRIPRYHRKAGVLAMIHETM